MASSRRIDRGRPLGMSRDHFKIDRLFKLMLLLQDTYAMEITSLAVDSVDSFFSVYNIE